MVFEILIYLLMVIPSLIFKLILKLKGRKIWLIAESRYEACDNGFYLYKHLRKHHKDIEAYYAIDPKSKYYNDVLKYGNVIKYGSLKHYLYYMVAINISNYENSSPAPRLFNFLHIHLNMYNNRVFLQRGITKDNIESLHYKNTKFKMFICGALKEYEYVKENYGYPSDAVKYLGFPRFDEWNRIDTVSKDILIMPTYRNKVSNESKYFKKWNSLLNNDMLIKYIEENNINIYVYPHIKMHKYIDNFKTKSNNIIIVNDNITDLLKRCSLLVTDYSSVYMDFAYMNKPVIYYQFDYNDYRKEMYPEGYYRYSKDAFGKIVFDEEDLVKKIIAYINLDYRMEKVYADRMNKFFAKKDTLNSERVFMAIEEMGD